MTTAIEFLEAMGRSAAPPAGADFEAAVAGLGIDTAQRQALLARDTAALARLLRGRPACGRHARADAG
ncbi:MULTISPECIES: hypothetical protein [Luteimonas]|uniref:hypothetical protein n=1 Tax=Luteimonas TaxID=83614 RepID=UPI000C7AADC6|nr:MULTISPECIES: hypothetical protein [Luteimonas]